MAQLRCITALRQGGYSAVVGEIVDSTHYLAVKYPSFFGTLTAGDQHYAGTLGPVLNSTTGGSLYRIIVNSGGTLSTEVAT